MSWLPEGLCGPPCKWGVAHTRGLPMCSSSPLPPTETPAPNRDPCPWPSSPAPSPSLVFLLLHPYTSTPWPRVSRRPGGDPVGPGVPGAPQHPGSFPAASQVLERAPGNQRQEPGLPPSSGLGCGQQQAHRSGAVPRARPHRRDSKLRSAGAINVKWPTTDTAEPTVGRSSPPLEAGPPAWALSRLLGPWKEGLGKARLGAGWTVRWRALGVPMVRASAQQPPCSSPPHSTPAKYQLVLCNISGALCFCGPSLCPEWCQVTASDPSGGHLVHTQGDLGWTWGPCVPDRHPPRNSRTGGPSRGSDDGRRARALQWPCPASPHSHPTDQVGDRTVQKVQGKQRDGRQGPALL